jgi:hypothetical protein
LPDPARWNAYYSLDDGLTWHFDDFVTGDKRQYSPDGGQHFMCIVGVDANGREVTRWSNAVRPDDASPGLVEGLVQFYKPSARLFGAVAVDAEHADVYRQVGHHFSLTLMRSLPRECGANGATAGGNPPDGAVSRSHLKKGPKGRSVALTRFGREIFVKLAVFTCTPS